MNPQEVALRERLGIPASATQVLVVGESTHWDPNWLKTSEEYYRQRVEPSLDRVLVELHGEPRRVFCLECVFFLRMYWERRPDCRAAITELMGSGRLRMVGSGITTPDTLLPPTEAILRDYALGQRWLDRHKPAEDGNGWIARLRLWRFPDQEPVMLRWNGRDIARAERCDARERSIESLPVTSGSLTLTPHGAIETVRLHLA